MYKTYKSYLFLFLFIKTVSPIPKAQRAKTPIATSTITTTAAISNDSKIQKFSFKNFFIIANLPTWLSIEGSTDVQNSNGSKNMPVLFL